MKPKLILYILVILACTKVQAQLHKGDSLYALGNYNAAIAAYMHSDDTAIKIAKSYEALGNTTKALNYYKKATDKNEASLLTQYEYGKLLLKAKRYKKADSIFEKVSKLDTNNSSFLYQSGLAKAALNDSTAITKFLQTTIIDKNHLNAQYQLAKHYTTKRQFKKAIEHIRMGLKADPTSIRFINLNALVYFYSKDYHGAVKQYELLLGLNHRNEQLHDNLAISYAQTNQFYKAIAQYKILISTYNDKNPSYFFNMGKMYQAEKEYKKAIESINRAIALQDVPLDKQYLTLASIYKKKEDYKNTFLMIEKALKESPNDELLRYQYAVAADNYYKDEKAVIKMYEAYLERHGKNGRYRELAQQRIRDIKTKAHFEKEE